MARNRLELRAVVVGYYYWSYIPDGVVSVYVIKRPFRIYDQIQRASKNYGF